MNKIATYLNEHILGEATVVKEVRQHLSDDGGILAITPDVVVFPRVTNDIRKVARFAWQLAEKGHTLALTIRGNGNDPTGASVGSGVIIATTPYLNTVLTVLPKEKLVHVQPGVEAGTLQQLLRWHGLQLSSLPKNARRSTVGGILANNSAGQTGFLADTIQKMEVVLANGDVIETGRISRRELSSKKLALQTLEGEIYRKLEGLLEDNEALIAQLQSAGIDKNIGYHAITKVKQKDGSIDLTPLIVGSQGTLGVITEVVLAADFYNQNYDQAILTVESSEKARDIADQLKKLEPSTLEIYSGELFQRASANGVRFSLLGDTEGVGAVIYIRFGDFSDHARKGKLKKAHKLLKKLNVSLIDSADREPAEFDQITSVGTIIETIGEKAASLPVLHGARVNQDRREAFYEALATLEQRHHLTLPVEENVLTGVIHAYPALHLNSVSDKQKLFKILHDYAQAVEAAGGSVIGDGGEGRLKANAAWATLDEGVAELYQQIRAIFDPFGILNPGVKQKVELRHVVGALRTHYDPTSLL